MHRVSPVNDPECAWWQRARTGRRPQAFCLTRRTSAPPLCRPHPAHPTSPTAKKPPCFFLPPAELIPRRLPARRTPPRCPGPPAQAAVGVRRSASIRHPSRLAIVRAQQTLVRNTLDAYSEIGSGPAAPDNHPVQHAVVLMNQEDHPMADDPYHRARVAVRPGQARPVT